MTIAYLNQHIFTVDHQQSMIIIMKDFLVVFDFEEILISAAELQDAILLQDCYPETQPLFVTGGWRHPTKAERIPNITPGNDPALRKLRTNHDREGG